MMQCTATMADYYRYLAIPNGQRFDFAPIVEEASEREPRRDPISQKDSVIP